MFRYENGETENCLELWNRDGKVKIAKWEKVLTIYILQGLRWNDTPCSFESYFVCEV